MINNKIKCYKKFKDIKMNSEKKVLFLIFSLILLMVVCVFTHAPGLINKQDTTNVTEVVSPEKTVEKLEEKIVEAPKAEEEVEQTKQAVEEEPKAQESQIEESTQTEEPVATEESTQTQEVVEENLEPLVTTDKRYTRTGNEKNIEDLSRTAQELQVKMSEFVKENPIIFTKDSFAVTAKSDETVQRVAEALKEFPAIKIEVAGHTDASGAADINKIISKERAKSVRARLVSLGIEKDRIKARGYGENIALEGLNKYSKQNRRVEFNIIEE